MKTILCLCLSTQNVNIDKTIFGHIPDWYGVAYRDEYYDYEHDESNGMFGNDG